jgi:hypothetical protein
VRHRVLARSEHEVPRRCAAHHGRVGLHEGVWVVPESQSPRVPERHLDTSMLAVVLQLS